jgi:hypothetical protein
VLDRFDLHRLVHAVPLEVLNFYRSPLLTYVRERDLE